jgi:hypothetical protein
MEDSRIWNRRMSTSLRAHQAPEVVFRETVKKNISAIANQPVLLYRDKMETRIRVRYFQHKHSITRVNKISNIIIV